MKQMFTLLMVCLTAFGHGQNYQPINSFTSRFFSSDPDIAESGFRTDSVFVNGMDSTYFMHNSSFRFDVDGSNDHCVRLNSIPFLGNSVTVRNNGIATFLNHSNDTVTIKYSANLSESWTLMEVDSDTILIATVVNINSQNWFGISELVKTISISAYNSSNQPITHPSNAYQILLGETLGVLQFLDLNTFPSNPISRTAVGDDQLNTGIRRISNSEVFDFDLCDVFHYEKHNENGSLPPDDWYYTMTILDKQVSGNAVTYVTKKEGFRYYMQASSGFPPYVSITEPISTIDTIVHSYTASLPPLLFPAELVLSIDSSAGDFTTTWPNPPKYSKFAGRSSYTTSNYNTYWIWSDTLPDFDVCISDFTNGCCPAPYYLHSSSYAEGLGLIDGFLYSEADFVHIRTKMVYFNKCGEEWGLPISESLLNGMNSIEAKPSFNLYPNPASKSVKLQLSDPSFPTEMTASVSDVVGRTITNLELQSSSLDIDVSSWPNGVYFITLTDEKQNRFSKRLVVQH